MKMIIKMVFVMAFLFGASQASAQLVGWEATVVARDSSADLHYRNVSGPTAMACDSSRLAAVADFSALGYVIVDSGICQPRFKYSFKHHFEKYLVMPEYIWPIPGPVCLSCPLFSKENITRVYPEHVTKVNDLVTKYRVREYNKALLELQMKFNLEGFEKEVFAIEQQLGR